MARNAQDDHGGQVSSQHNITHDAHSGDPVALPFAHLGDVEILRDGQDLVLQSQGKTVTIEHYFTADTPPQMTAQDGMALTPPLVRSFVQPMDGVQYAQKGSVDDASPIGMIREASGEASITHPNGVTVKAAIGTPVYQGDIIETKGDGAVNITFIDDTSFAVSENARLAIDEYVFDPASQSGENSFSVLRGVFVFTSGLIGREDPDDVRIETPVGSIGIRGTTIMGHINPDGESRITVVEGAIVVTNPSGETTLSQQFETVTLSGANTPMGEAAVLSADQIANSYNVLRSVSAPLFSSFDPAGQDSGEAAPAPDSETLQQTAPGPAPAEQPATPAEPAAEPVNKTDAAPADTTTTADAVSQDTLETADNLTSFDAGFDHSAGIENAGALNNSIPGGTASQPVTIASLFSAAPAPFFGTAPERSPAPEGGISVSPVQPVDTGLLKPPVTTTPVTPPGGGVTPTPTPPTSGTIDLSLNDVIGNNTGGLYISGTTAGGGFGHAITMIGDRNNNGSVDYAVVDNISNGGSLYIHDGAGGQQKINLGSAFGLNDTTGLTVAGIGDFNRDGFNDIVIGAPLSDEGGTVSGGRVIIASGANPTQSVMEVLGFASGHFTGYSVSGIGDYNGDGISDLIIGAPYDAGQGRTYVLFGNDSATTINVNTLSPSQGFVLPGGMGQKFGSDVAGIGDFNGDGYSDLAVAELGSGKVSVYFGNLNGTAATPLTITGIGTESGAKHLPIASMGDMNGDGKADFAILDTLNDTAHIFYGGHHNTGMIGVNASNLKITLNAGSDLVSMGSAGDFNGDGYSDAAFATRTGSQMDIYVFYGDNTLSGTVNLDTVTDDKVFHMTLDLASSQFGFADPLNAEVTLSLTSAGDVNNDGFDDLLIGSPQFSDEHGGLLIIYGRADSYDLANGKVQLGVIATQSGQGLVGGSGAETLTNQNGGTTYDNIAFKGGGGNDVINLFGNSVRGIDGGTGHDTLNLMSGGNIDLRGLDDNLSSIEQINIGSTTSGTLTLQIDQIFQLLQQSSDGTLSFMAGSGGAQLQIDNNGTNRTSLDELGFTNNGVSGSSESWGFGDYTLYIDSNIAVNVATV